MFDLATQQWSRQDTTGRQAAPRFHFHLRICASALVCSTINHIKLSHGGRKEERQREMDLEGSQSNYCTASFAALWSVVIATVM